MKRNVFLLGLILLFASGCALRKNDPYVVLVSFDGFRYDYVERFDLPNFKNFIRHGAAAQALIPSFPSKTFPNHYTIVTGLYPGNHGLVDNHFYDPELNKYYSMYNRNAVADSSFYGGVPLWRLARQNGIRSASYFWVGSELKADHQRPDYQFDYNGAIPFDARVDQVLAWLRLPEAQRPRFIALYFSSPDTESHRYGPFGEKIREKTLALDSLLGRLMKGVESTKLPVNVILVSDHGMSQLIQHPDTYIFLEDIIERGRGIRMINGGTQVHVYTESAQAADSLAGVLKPAAKDYTVLKRSEFPPQWHYEHSRAGEIILVAGAGKIFISGDRQKFLQGLELTKTFGVHGYDADLVDDMNGIFYAKGPNVRAGATLPAFRNIHVYPFIAEILGLRYKAIDGDFSILKPAYRK